MKIEKDNFLWFIIYGLFFMALQLTANTQIYESFYIEYHFNMLLKLAYIVVFQYNFSDVFCVDFSLVSSFWAQNSI